VLECYLTFFIDSSLLRNAKFSVRIQEVTQVGYPHFDIAFPKFQFLLSHRCKLVNFYRWTSFRRIPRRFHLSILLQLLKRPINL